MCLINIGGKVFDTTVEQVVRLLRDDTRKVQDEYLKDIKVLSTSLLVTCPVHKNHSENHPSCIVATESNEIYPVGNWHCFTCNSNGDLLELISICLSSTRKEALSWLDSKFDDVIVDSITILPAIDSMTTNLVETIPEEVLYSYDRYHPYLASRKISENIAKRFKVGYNSITESITFPCWDWNNNLVAINERSIYTKRFKLQGNKNKEIYLLNFIKQDMLNGIEYPFIVICESQINALYAWSLGLPAVALLGTGSQYQYNILNTYKPSSSYVLCFDGDFAGQSGATKFKHNVKDALITTLELPTGKDLNDLTIEQAQQLFNNNNITWRIKQ